VLKKVTRNDIPAHASGLIRNKVYTPKGEEGLAPEKIPAFKVGDYVRPVTKQNTMGTIVEIKWDGERYVYRFQQDPRLKTHHPPRDEQWRDDEFELWQRPPDMVFELINKIAQGK